MSEMKPELKPDPKPDPRTDYGTPADRKMTTGVALANGGAIGLVTGGSEWLMLECFKTGHWQYVPPHPSLVAAAAPIVILPVALWFAQILQIIGDIIKNKLRREDRS